MEVGMLQYPPGDPRMIDTIVHQLKSQGIFDQFRKECIADVDTKPAYQNLHQRVEGTVSGFLAHQVWRRDLNKNQVRESLRKHIHESGYLDLGVERIVDQVVNPKIMTVLVPQVEDVVYKFIGIEKPKKATVNHTPIAPRDLLPKDLDPVSPESDEVKKSRSNSVEEGEFDDHDKDGGTPPPFNTLETSNDNSMGSHLSGISGLTSPDDHLSNISYIGGKTPPRKSLEGDSNLSKVSLESMRSLSAMEIEHSESYNQMELDPPTPYERTVFDKPSRLEKSDADESPRLERAEADSASCFERADADKPPRFERVEAEKARSFERTEVERRSSYERTEVERRLSYERTEVERRSSYERPDRLVEFRRGSCSESETEFETSSDEESSPEHEPLDGAMSPIDALHIDLDRADMGPKDEPKGPQTQVAAKAAALDAPPKPVAVEVPSKVATDDGKLLANDGVVLAMKEKTDSVVKEERAREEPKVIVKDVEGTSKDKPTKKPEKADLKPLKKESEKTEQDAKKSSAKDGSVKKEEKKQESDKNTRKTDKDKDAKRQEKTKKDEKQPKDDTRKEDRLTKKSDKSEKEDVKKEDKSAKKEDRSKKDDKGGRKEERRSSHSSHRSSHHSKPRKGEDEGKKKSEEGRKREDDAKKSDEGRKREDDAKKRDNEGRKKDDDAKKKDGDRKRKEDDAKRKKDLHKTKNGKSEKSGASKDKEGKVKEGPRREGDGSKGDAGKERKEQTKDKDPAAQDKDLSTRNKDLSSKNKDFSTKNKDSSTKNKDSSAKDKDTSAKDQDSSATKDKDLSLKERDRREKERKSRAAAKRKKAEDDHGAHRDRRSEDRRSADGDSSGAARERPPPAGNATPATARPKAGRGSEQGGQSSSQAGGNAEQAELTGKKAGKFPEQEEASHTGGKSSERGKGKAVRRSSSHGSSSRSLDDKPKVGPVRPASPELRGFADVDETELRRFASFLSRLNAAHQRGHGGLTLDSESEELSPPKPKARRGRPPLAKNRLGRPPAKAKAGQLPFSKGKRAEAARVTNRLQVSLKQLVFKEKSSPGEEILDLAVDKSDVLDKSDLALDKPDSAQDKPDLALDESDSANLSGDEKTEVQPGISPGKSTEPATKPDVVEALAPVVEKSAVVEALAPLVEKSAVVEALAPVVEKLAVVEALAPVVEKSPDDEEAEEHDIFRERPTVDEPMRPDAETNDHDIFKEHDIAIYGQLSKEHDILYGSHRDGVCETNVVAEKRAWPCETDVGAGAKRARSSSDCLAEKRYEARDFTVESSVVKCADAGAVPAKAKVYESRDLTAVPRPPSSGSDGPRSRPPSVTDGPRSRPPSALEVRPPSETDGSEMRPPPAAASPGAGRRTRQPSTRYSASDYSLEAEGDESVRPRAAIGRKRSWPREAEADNNNVGGGVLGPAEAPLGAPAEEAEVKKPKVGRPRGRPPGSKKPKEAVAETKLPLPEGAKARAATPTFVMPLSPESDVSASSAELANRKAPSVSPTPAPAPPATNKRGVAAASRAQRYASDDLYKPRPLFSRGRRARPPLTDGEAAPRQRL